MAGTIVKIKQSAQPLKVPDKDTLIQGELALNTADHKLYSKDASGNVFEVTSSAASVLPSMVGNNKKFLMTDGADTSWEAVDLFNIDGGSSSTVFGTDDTIFDGGAA